MDGQRQDEHQVGEGRQTRAAVRGDDTSALLGLSNPARLSRTEFRVCLLLSQGHDASGVAAAMAIAPATLRAHLRRIFLKTHTASLVELAQRLAAEASQGPADEAVPGAPGRTY